MKKRRRLLQLTDMDVGIFVSYELTAEMLVTKLFRLFTLSTIPLKQVMDIREAKTEDVTPLNRFNWFNFIPACRKMGPIYTLQAAENRPRIFMRLDRGSHIEMKLALDRLTCE